MLLTSTQINSLLLLRDTISLDAARESVEKTSFSHDDHQAALDALDLRRLQSIVDGDKLCQDIGKAGHHYYVRARIILNVT